MFKKLRFSILSFLFCLTAIAFVFIQSKGIEGGLDSWEHFLISKFSIKYPDLFLNQWNKPIFTIFTCLPTQLGINGLIVFNIICLMSAAWLLDMTMKHIGFKNSWVIQIFVIFTPILFLNTVSGLTEPLTILFVAVFIYLYFHDYTKSSLVVSGFLPLVRTEGFVLLGAILILVLMDKKWKQLPYLFIGALMMNGIGFAITGKPFWIISENPYLQFEFKKGFDPGHGSFGHFFNLSKPIFGLPITVLILFSNLYFIYAKIAKINIHRIFVFSLYSFWLYFLAHATIYYFGILGSHGLIRPMMVLAPFSAIMIYIFIDKIFRAFHHKKRQIVFFFFSFVTVWAAYDTTGFPKPYRYNQVTIPEDITQRNIILAGQWLIDNNIKDRTIIHQSPYFDCYFDKDPYDKYSSYRIWSIDQANDWSEYGSIVIWDSYFALREGNLKLEWLEKHPDYRLLHIVKDADGNSERDVYIYEKKFGNVK
jgi:hypothetical protein